MKRMLAEIKVKNVSDNIHASQTIAGGLPLLDVQPSILVFDSDSNDEELAYKLYVNVLATFCKAYHGKMMTFGLKIFDER